MTALPLPRVATCNGRNRLLLQPQSRSAIRAVPRMSLSSSTLQAKTRSSIADAGVIIDWRINHGTANVYSDRVS